MRTFIFLPPLKGMTGGVAVLHQVAQHLHSGGFTVSVVPREAGTPLPEGVPVCPWQDLALTPDDLWLVPEGWVNALMPGLQAKARNVVYVQNWSYLLSALPEGVHWPQLDVSFLNVSEPVAWFTQQVTGRQGPILRPGINTALFHPASDAPASASVPVIAWMPRKNKALAVRIRETFEARRALLGKQPARWVEIHGMSPQQVAEALRSAHIFLATGFPEGCPLPPLEALASGCIVTGFSGMGGWDYMRQAMPPELGGHAPWWPQREVPWQGNSLIVADADVAAAANGLELTAGWLESGAPELMALRQNSAATVAAYTVEKQREAVLGLWREAENKKIF
ncbi:glycosyltransferase family 1 protein [Desulfovibrio mangrovi]|uniref:glycosyltransferase family 1 protein n=1 Tax=Desulfovibrio mangrovi TaxID=2976983 RepID=UPI0022453C72|nr:glycosyltransferase family 1 protein [Desulfovibrio mangrovi]UZP66368.1 glycosyltransferase family 1 protein [Desulfovibrio mangrovi]